MYGKTFQLVLLSGRILMFLQVHPHAKIYFEFRPDLLSLLIIPGSSLNPLYVLSFAICLLSAQYQLEVIAP